MSSAAKKKKNKKKGQQGQRISAEERLLDAAENGNLSLVEELINNPNVNIYCVDFLGRSPLRLATENEQEEIVQLFLNKLYRDADPEGYLAVYESFLLSISVDSEGVAEVILKHPIYEFISPDDMAYMLHGDSQFPADITPLSLAAEKNLVEIVSMLIKKGERIHAPHSFTCDCSHCRTEQTMDELRFARTRLNAYRGLSSPSYIAILSDMMGHDPFLAAFELARELRTVAKVEKHFGIEYIELADNLSKFCTNLLDHVRGNDELDVILNNIGECTGCPEGRQEELIRVTQAIRYREKHFIAHPSCQKKLSTLWYGNVRIWERTPMWLKPIMVLCYWAMYPIFAIMFWFTPVPRIVEFMRTPFVKFVAHSCSFITFLCIVISFSWTENSDSTLGVSDKEIEIVMEYYQKYHTRLINTSSFFENDRLIVRPHFPGVIQILLCCWLVGMLWNEIKQVYDCGFVGYVSNMFNIMDSVSLAMYLASFILRFITYSKTMAAIDLFAVERTWTRIFIGDYRSLVDFYWLVADRFYWRHDDPYNVSEGLFAVANVLSFFRLFNLLAMSDVLGPLQVSLERMISDIMKFTAIFAIVFLAFLVGFNNLYWYYAAGQRERVESKDHAGDEPILAEEAFGTMLDTFRTIMFALFGLGDADIVQLAPVYENSMFTTTVGYILLGVFNWVAVIVLMNMLIAIMSMSFDRIQQDADVEWKFSRTVLFMEFLDSGTTMCVPLNVIPSPKSIVRLIITPIRHCYGAFKNKCCNRSTGSPDNNNGEVQAMELGRENEAYTPESAGATHSEGIEVQNEEDGHDKRHGITMPSFKLVLKRVIKRYIFEKADGDNEGSQEVEELKQDISRFRFEIVNQMNTQQDLLIRLIQRDQPQVASPPKEANRSSSSDDDDEYDPIARGRNRNRKLQELMKKPEVFKKTACDMQVQTDPIRPPTPPPPPPPPQTRDACVATDDELTVDEGTQVEPEPEPESEPEPEPEPEPIPPPNNLGSPLAEDMSDSDSEDVPSGRVRQIVKSMENIRKRTGTSS